jgi:hypothetical protein
MGLKVAQEYRTNSFSRIPGGVTVEVETTDNRRFEYDNIKNPMAYIAKFQNDPKIKNIWIKPLDAEKIKMK